MAKQDDDFKLDRNGGPEKIARAMYSAKAYRKRNKGNSNSKEWSWTVRLVALALAATWLYIFLH